MSLEGIQHRRPSARGVTVAADRREALRELGRLPGEHEPVDSTKESQRHSLLVGRVETPVEELPDRAGGGDVAGHSVEELAVERRPHGVAGQLVDADHPDEGRLGHARHGTGIPCAPHGT